MPLHERAAQRRDSVRRHPAEQHKAAVGLVDGRSGAQQSEPVAHPREHVLVHASPREREFLALALELRELGREFGMPCARRLELAGQRQAGEIVRQPHLGDLGAAQAFLELAREFLLGREQAEPRPILGARGAHLGTEQHAAGHARQLLEGSGIAHLDADVLEAGPLCVVRRERLHRGQEHEVAVETGELGLQRITSLGTHLARLEVLRDQRGDRIDRPRWTQVRLACRDGRQQLEQPFDLDLEVL